MAQVPTDPVTTAAAFTSPTLADSALSTATAPTTSTLTEAVKQIEDNLTETPLDWLTLQLLGISILQYLVAFVLVVAGLLGRRIAIYVLSRYGQPDKGDVGRFDEQLARAAANPGGMAVAVLGVFAAIKTLGLPLWVDQFATNLTLAILYVVAAWFAFNVADILSGYLERRSSRTETRYDEQLVPILRKSLKVFVSIVVTVQVLDQFGDVKGLLAGLGLGGLGFALAARDSIANIFGSIVILADRPFKIGDWIEGGGVEGTVEEIGFRSTRIRTFAKSLITVPNSVVANWAINNWSEMPIRRVKMTVGVSYEATPQQMDAAVEGIRTILRKDKRIYQDFFLVNFTDFGADALEILLYYFTVTTNWAEYLQIRQEINLAIMRLLSELGMEIAFPTRTVYLRQDTPPELPPQFREEDTMPRA